MSAASATELVGGQQESRSLYRIMLWAYVSAYPLTALFLAVGVFSGSSALLAVSAQNIVFIVVGTFAIYALRQVLQDNTFALPYGAGKLENFSSFVLGFSYLPFAAYLLFASGERLLAPEEVRYDLTLVPLAISVARSLLLYLQVRRLARRSPNPSPMLRSYVADFRITMLSDGGVIASLSVGWLLVSSGWVGLGDRVDPLVAVAIALFMVWTGIYEARHNLRALLDLPLPERSQLAIMRVLARHFADYESIGTLYTRASGKRRFVELELGFASDQTVGHVHRLAHSMEKALGAELPDLEFRVVPVAAEEIDYV